MKKRKNNLDEMQEQKMLHIEHNACWLCFGGLLVAIYIQMAMGNTDFRYIGGESLILLVACFYLLGACLKNGIWDRKLKPDLKTNVGVSLVAGLAVGGFWGIVSYVRYHALAGSVATFVMMFLSVSVLTLLLLAIASAIWKWKKNRLDAQADKESEE